MVESILPKEETIIDPLYEPLKLNRYELCTNLKMLSNVSHLRYGFSPYLLFDVEGWRKVVKYVGNETEIEAIEEKYKAFSDKLKKYLDKLETLQEDTNNNRNDIYEELKEKRDDIIEKYNETKTIYRKTSDEFLWADYAKPGIYDTSTDKFKENYEKIAHFSRLDYPIKVKCPKHKKEQVREQFMCEEGKIYSMKEALLRTFELRRARWLQMSGSLHTVHCASTHTRLSHQIGSMVAGVNALREIDVYPHGDVSMSLGEYLLMKGELHEFLMANFLHDIGHSPLSHVLEPNPFIELDHEEITNNLILGKKVEGERGMDWYVAERYLLKMKTIKDFEHRFFENQYDPRYNVCVKKNWTDEKERKANFLDCLDKNREILESEVVTVSEVLSNFGVDKDRVVEILSGATFCPKKKCRRLLKIKDGKVEKCENCGAVEVKSEKIYNIQFLNKLIESEIDIDRMDHVKRDSVVCGLSLTSFRLLELLSSMSIVLPDSDVYNEIDNKKRYLFSWDEIPGNGDEKFIEFLKDEFKIEWAKTENIQKIGDGSTIIVSNKENRLSLKLYGEKTKVKLKINDGRVDEFTVKTENGTPNIYKKSNGPYILISENGLLYVMDLLNARKSVFNDILYSDENNWINGVVNQITALAVRYLPHIKIMLPFITDQILMHFYTNDLFLGTQIEKLNRLFHGKMDCSGYSEPIRLKLQDGAIVTEDNLKEIYRVIEKINDDREYEKLELPVLVFYTNIKSTKCPVCGKRELMMVNNSGSVYKCPNCNSEIMEKDVGKCLKITLANEKNKNFSVENRDLDTYKIIVVKTEKNGMINTCKVEPLKKKWDPMLVFGKKFKIHVNKIDMDEKYLQFKVLVGKYNDDTFQERYPDRPNESEVKNLFYFWVSDFCKEDMMERINREVKIERFVDLFIDLDNINGVS